MADKGLVVPVKVKLEADAKDAADFAKTILSHLDLGKAFKSQNISDIDTYIKQKAYDKAYKKTGDEEEAKKAAESAGMSDKERETLGIVKELSGVMKGFGDSIIRFTQNTLGIVEDIYAQLKKSSPLLQTIESLFDLAMQLFFMPLGNKLAEVMLPAVVSMMDSISEIWEKFDGKSLSEMLATAIDLGVNLLANYFIMLGDELSDQGGAVGSIGKLLNTIGDFLREDGLKLIELVTSIMSFIIDNLGKLIVTAMEFYIASLAIQAGIYAYLMTGIFKDFGAGTAAGLATSATVAGGANLALFGTGVGGSLWSMGDGGYVPATPGGNIIRVAENGEGEYIIPQSMMNDIMGNSYDGVITPLSSALPSIDVPSSARTHTNVTNNFTFNGLTNDELRYIIRDEVDSMISQSKYKGGY